MIQKNISLCVIVILLSGCTLIPSGLEDGYSINAFELSEECPRVCWLGIQPGVTTWHDAVVILNSSDQIDQKKTIQFSESDFRFVWFTNKQKKPTSWIGIVLENEVVRSISFWPLRPITVGDFIMVFGEPDEISISLEIPADAIYINYILYFSDIQVMMDVDTYDFSGPAASDSPKFLGINLEFDGDELAAWRAEKYAGRQPWLGYGRIKEYLPGVTLPESP